MFVIKQFRLLFYINASGFVRAPNPLTIHCSFRSTFCLAIAQVAERNICRCCAHSCDGRTKAIANLKLQKKTQKTFLISRVCNCEQYFTPNS